MADSTLQSFGGLTLLMGEPDASRKGLSCVNTALRLFGLETLFGSAQLKERRWVGLNVLRAGVSSGYKTYAVEGGASAINQGKQRMQRAKRLLNESGTGILNQWDEAKDCYAEAAEAFLQAGAYVEAGEAFWLASECVAKLSSDVEEAGYLTQAAAAYLSVSPLDAVTCLQRAIKIHAASGSHCKVAKSERQVAEIYEGIYQQSGDCLDLESVLLHYQQAEALYKARGPQYLTERNVCLSKIGGYEALLGHHDAAISTFEMLNKTLTGDKVKAEGLFRAMLCFLGAITVRHRLPGIERAQAAFAHYSDIEPQFQSGIEYDLIKALLLSVTKQDIGAFDAAVACYRACRNKEFWVDHMLEKVEKNLLEVLDTIDKKTFGKAP